MQQLKLNGRKPIIFFCIKLIILIGILTFVYFKISDNQDIWNQLQQKIRIITSSTSVPMLMLPLILMPFNWLLEGLKWKVLASQVVKLSNWQAFVGVLLGLSLSFVTPHGLGDYAGRIWLTDSNARGKLIGPIFLGRLMQLFWTLFFGVWGVCVLLEAQQAIDYTYGTYLLGTFVLLVLASFVYFIIQRFGNSDNYWLNWLAQVFISMSKYNKSQFGMGMLFSLLRYLTFFLQFYILLKLVNIDLPFYILGAGITWIFLAKSVIPSFNFLSDLGLREFSALLFFEYFTVHSVDVILASFTLWTINILVPTLIGLLFVFKLKLWR